MENYSNYFFFHLVQIPYSHLFIARKKTADDSDTYLIYTVAASQL